MNNKNILSIDFGGMSVKYSLMNASKELDSAVTDSKTIIESHAIAAKDVVKKFEHFEDKFGKIEGIAISFNSPVRDKSFVRWGVISGEWQYEDMIEHLRQQGIPKDIQVIMLNDAKAALYAEASIGSAKGYANAVMLTFGTAIGGAALIEGSLVNGKSALGAELSNPVMHFDGKNFNSIKLWHSYASMTSFQNNYKELSGSSKSGLEIFELFDRGDEIAKEAVERLYKSIAVVIYNTVYSYGEEVVVIGGGLSNRTSADKEIKQYLDELSKELKMEIPVEIKLAKVANKAGALGAYYYFLDKAVY